MANTAWQKREEQDARRMMEAIERNYIEDGDDEYNNALHAMMEKAFSIVKEEINGNWWNFKGQDQLIAAVEKVFEMTENCETYDEIYEICK